MEYTIEKREEITIAGIKTITDNTGGVTLIPQTWERFFADKILDRIHNIIPGSGLYAVYTDYESDENGKYAFVLGTRTQSSDQSEEMSTLMIPSGNYAVFTAAGKDEVISAWQYIWQNRIKRTYLSDFEYYDAATKDVKIFVGIH